ncbi:MAG TPA: hypothetical protein VLZ75_12965 [Chitinophagales bacterium]|nr:hypothetical protein [Chitinophagales bacterium]
MGKTDKIITIVLGVIMIIVSVLVTYFNTVITGPLPDGFITPIIALEFMNNTKDLSNFFNIITIDALKYSLTIGNQIDYVFMFSYGLFALMCGRLMYLETKVKALWLSFPLVALIITADAFENLNIAEILAMNDYQNAGLILDQLQLFTWLKWGSLSALMLLYSVYFFQGNWWKIMIGFVLASTFILYGVAFYLRGIYCEIFSLSILLAYLSLLIFAIFWKPIRPQTIDHTTLNY